MGKSTDMQETKRTVSRPEKLIPPIPAPFDEVLKSVGRPVEKANAPPKS